MLERLTPAELNFAETDWSTWAHDAQLPPEASGGREDWNCWVIIGGRGSGKTRAGAEWIRSLIRDRKRVDVPLRIALVGPSYSEAREVMVEGVSGLRSLEWFGREPTFVSSRRMLVWPDGSTAQLFSAEDPEDLRGPQFDAAWCDEAGKWRNAQVTFDMLQFGLRLGARPRQVVTTTPRPTPLLRGLLDDPQVVCSRMRTHDNAQNLPEAFINAVETRYGGTRLGRQELDGELIDDIEDGLLDREALEAGRTRYAPDLVHVVVGVDPPTSHKAAGSVCGIVCAGVCAQGEIYVLEDASVANVTPSQWANQVARCFESWSADRVIGEVNQGGDMVETVLRAAHPQISFRPVHASRGKRTRAEPVAALYERALVHHVGAFAELEDQMCNFDSDGLSLGQSPDRLDALVWAVHELVLARSAAAPRVRSA